jgi:hypothetical protein
LSLGKFAYLRLGSPESKIEVSYRADIGTTPLEFLHVQLIADTSSDVWRRASSMKELVGFPIGGYGWLPRAEWPYFIFRRHVAPSPGARAQRWRLLATCRHRRRSV